MNKHTPGPWKISVIDYRTITAQPYQNKDGHWVSPAVAIVKERTGETHYNALLISTAPNGYALAEHIVTMADDTYLEGHPEWLEIVNEACALIAKATGQTP